MTRIRLVYEYVKFLLKKPEKIKHIFFIMFRVEYYGKVILKGKEKYFDYRGEVGYEISQ